MNVTATAPKAQINATRLAFQASCELEGLLIMLQQLTTKRIDEPEADDKCGLYVLRGLIHRAYAVNSVLMNHITGDDDDLQDIVQGTVPVALRLGVH